jgi:ribonucleotide reductase alpha subunit
MLSCSIEHPNSEQFIDAKTEAGKVTGANISVKITDEFMNAVLAKTEYIQKFPVGSENPAVTNTIDAKKLWDKIIHNAWKWAEPGILYWDTIIKESVPDCYNDLGFKTVSTNPCVVGNTLIAVADGRNAISIKQLTLEGKDVPVYCLDNNGNIAIRTMRNPRITGYKQHIYKVTIEGGHFFRVTGNHKFKLKSGEYIETKKLKYGDSLHIMTKTIAGFHDIIKKSNSKSQDYAWLSNTGKKGFILEHRIISNVNTKEKKLVVHHKDFNGLNNRPNNLEIMLKNEHNLLHSTNMIGKKNPYHKMNDDWKKKFASHKGEKNHKFKSNLTNSNIKEHAIILTRKLGRKFSKKDWILYAKENNLPQNFTKFRYDELGNIINLANWAAIKMGLNMINVDPRLVKTYNLALDNGYDAKIIDNEVLVNKNCEYCGNIFNINYFKREISFCSHLCSLNYINKNREICDKRINTINNTYSEKSKKTKEEQIKIYSDLKFNLKREPHLYEWENECKLNSIPFRLKTKYGFETFNELKKESEYYNHKIVSIELDGVEDVYNGTVDDFHNFYMGYFEELNQYNKPKYLCINSLQCGEIPLCPYDSCRLLSLNLYSYVENPFTKDAKFNFELFEQHAMIAQRFMDDIVDLEIEKIEAILKKIETDPEEEHIKQVEKEIWLKIQDKSREGRRTGLGITAEGDMVAALGLTYGTQEATNFSVKVHKSLAISAYKSSCIMANERGSFPIYDYERELNNPFINRLRKEYPELDELLKKGRRNIALLTAAPTGTVSLMTQTTSGIEPAFLIVYKRRKKINPNDKNVTVSFVDETGDSWEEYVVFHHKFLIWLQVNGYNIDEVKKMSMEDIQKIVEKSPYYKATSNDVDWVEKVKLQGAIQKYVDHSISVTINLPESVTEELVSKVYETGWTSGCKGMTVYRDGSRSGVLVSNEKKKDEQTYYEDTNAPKRPKILHGDVHRFKNKGEDWIAFVGMIMNGGNKLRPYEIFTGLQEDIAIPKYIEHGEIIKTKEKDIDENGNEIMKSRYDFVYKDKEGYVQTFHGLNRIFNKEFWNVGKMISAILRHRMPLKNVVDLIEGLKFTDDSIVTWKQGVKRTIKKYVKDGTSTNEKCPDCEADLIFEDGCKKCLNCGYSKC